MARDETYAKNLECPKCKAKGVVNLSEPAHIFNRDYADNPKIGKTVGNFKANYDENGTLNARCLDCDHTFKA